MKHSKTQLTTTNYSLLLLMIFATLLSSVSSALTIAETHISTSRDPKRASICTYYSANYTSSQMATSSSYINQYSYLSTQEIQDIMFKNDYMQLKTQTILIVAPHILIFSIFAIIWIPLCCCCMWPEKHPTCRTLRKPQKEMYGKCELKWTAYCASIFFFMIMAGGILGIIKGAEIVYYYNDVGCKTAAVSDDTLNGRLSPTVENRFFVGLSPYSTDLVTFNTTFNTIWTQNQNSLQNAGNIFSNQILFENFIESIYTSYTDPTYTAAFFSDGTTHATVYSQFKGMHYGPSNNSATILGSIKSTTTNIFNQINTVLDPMKAAYANLTITTQATAQSQITSTVVSISTISASLLAFTNKWNHLFSNQAFFDQMLLVIKLFYGIFFGLATLGFLGAVILACFSVVKVRLIMYFACSFLFFFAFISFTLMIILAAIAPNLSQVCSYMDTKLQTGAGTADLFSRLGFTDMGKLYSNCMTDGTGWLINDLNPAFNTTFADLLLITQNTQLFNLVIPSYSTANLIAPFTSGFAKVTQVSNAELLQINDTVALNHITAVRTVSYSININCNTLNVQGDAWMPSYTLYSCPGGKAQNSPCLDLSSLSMCPSGCYEIQNQFQSASGDNSYSSTLATRYGNSGCNYFDYLDRLQRLWNIPRQSSMATVTTDLTNLQTKMTDYDTSFTSTQSSIGSYSTILQTNYNPLTNLTSGTFNGLDCRVLGESIIEMRDSLCVGVLNSVYYNLICLILISYGTLMAACCTVCAGIRHFRHLQKMQIHVGYKGVPVSIADTSKILQK